ncbi:GNAT family N-acetyltransferase [Bowdeniella nasicola]|uniref:GNAT family N-acetyltransferase n=1 Tax=Bowdeniella nasicola TaxID=208480 RepID=UPI001C9E8CA7|nr:GNAT family N-acetyltransferase [Bowdeniella nasicola]
MGVVIRPTTEADLPLVAGLWADGEVMAFVGFPDGLAQTDEEMARWYRQHVSQRPRTKRLAEHVNEYGSCYLEKTL